MFFIQKKLFGKSSDFLLFLRKNFAPRRSRVSNVAASGALVFARCLRRFNAGILCAGKMPANAAGCAPCFNKSDAPKASAHPLSVDNPRRPYHAPTAGVLKILPKQNAQKISAQKKRKRPTTASAKIKASQPLR